MVIANSSGRLAAAYMCMKDYSTYVVTACRYIIHVHVGKSWLKCWIMAVLEYQSSSAK